MLGKRIIVLALLALVGSQPLLARAAIGGAVSNAAREISERVPDGARIAVLNISSDYAALSDFVINELILNLVRVGSFQVVPRSSVELEVAQREFGFEMDGWVSKDDQRSLGQFLGVDIFVTDSIVRETANTYRLLVNAIHLESFTFQAAYGTSVRIDRQLRTLIAGRNSAVWFDYTTMQRVGMGAANMLFGMGSLRNGHRSGLIVTGGHGIGTILILSGVGEDEEPIMIGAVVMAVSMLVGYILPFFHTRPNPAVASVDNGFPLNIELVSDTDRGINGARVLYTIRF